MLVLGAGASSLKAVPMRVIPGVTLGLLLTGLDKRGALNSKSSLKGLGGLRGRCGRRLVTGAPGLGYEDTGGSFILILPDFHCLEHIVC